MKAERSQRRCRQAPGGGFTLVEVMVALMLFAFSVVVLAASYVNVLNSVEAVRVDQTLDQELAFVRAQVLVMEDRDDVEAGGDVPTPTHGNAQWTATIVPTQIADLFRLELKIELEGDGAAVKPRSVTENLYVLRTSWSEPTERDDLRAESRKRLDLLRSSRPL